MSSADALRENPSLHGFWSVTGHPGVVDAAADAGPDFIVVDTQHGVDLAQVDASLFTLMARYGVPGLVRVESLDLGRIGRALDLGAVGIVVPLVETPEDAARAVHATRYAPSGGRSYGMQTKRVGPFAEDPFVVIQVETGRAVEEIDSIAAVDGVDALYIGPADLGLGLAATPAPDLDAVFDGRVEGAESLTQAFRAVIDAADAQGIIPGLHTADGSSSTRAVEEGFRMTSVASDLGLIGGGLRQHLAAARRVEG